MNPPRPRLTVKRAMMAVALAALVLSVSVHRWRRLEADYRQMESFCANMERSFQGSRDPRDIALAGYFGSLRRKYEAAERRPWLPLAPDPPVP